MKRDADDLTEAAEPVSRQDLFDAGHDDRPMLQTIRAKCLDCCCDQPGEVRICRITSCPLWPYRMGTNPFAKPRGSGRRFSQGKSRKNGAEISAPDGSRGTMPVKRAA
jgi:hypothetical protein